MHETVQSGASGCESDRTFISASAKDKPRRKAGLCGSVRDRASGQKKRVNGFERVDMHVGNVTVCVVRSDAGDCRGKESPAKHANPRNLYNW